MKLKIITISAALLLLSGCSWWDSPLEVSKVSVDKAPLVLPDVDVVTLREIKWVIITPENYEEILKSKDDQSSFALFALTSKGYENLSLNIGDIMALIKQQKAIISAYEKYYNKENSQ
jgi:hypothetical protein